MKSSLSTYISFITIAMFLLPGCNTGKNTASNPSQVPVQENKNITTHTVQHTYTETTTAPSRAHEELPMRIQYKLDSAEEKYFRAYHDHAHAFPLSHMQDIAQRDMRIRQEVMAKNRDWYGTRVSSSPFCNYVAVLDEHLHTLHRQQKRLARYGHYESAAAMSYDIAQTEADLIALRNCITEHDRYIAEVQTRSIKNQVIINTALGHAPAVHFGWFWRI